VIEVRGEAAAGLDLPPGVGLPLCDQGKAAENKRIFDRLHSHKKEIEGAIGSELSWQRLDDKRACRVACTPAGGGWESNESKWPEIQDAMIFQPRVHAS
jgi:hypothetical protein